MTQLLAWATWSGVQFSWFVLLHQDSDWFNPNSVCTLRCVSSATTLAEHWSTNSFLTSLGAVVLQFKKRTVHHAKYPTLATVCPRPLARSIPLPQVHGPYSMILLKDLPSPSITPIFNPCSFPAQPNTAKDGGMGQLGFRTLEKTSKDAAFFFSQHLSHLPPCRQPVDQAYPEQLTPPKSWPSPSPRQSTPQYLSWWIAFETPDVSWTYQRLFSNRSSWLFSLNWFASQFQDT